MTTRYRIDPSQSRFTVQAFAAGLLSAFAHSPTFAVRDFAGEMRFQEGKVHGMAIDLTVQADSLELLDRVSAADGREIRQRMMTEVLEGATFPEIRYEARDVPAAPVSQGLFRLEIGGQLSLRGVSRSQPIHADLTIFGDGVRLQGETSLRLSDYQIKPVTAVGGAIKMKDELRLTFELVALPEAS
jgi:polyisoprenoid-binding protein YceI